MSKRSSTMLELLGCFRWLPSTTPPAWLAATPPACQHIPLAHWCALWSSILCQTCCRSPFCRPTGRNGVSRSSHSCCRPPPAAISDSAAEQSSSKTYTTRCAAADGRPRRVRRSAAAATNAAAGRRWRPAAPIPQQPGGQHERQQRAIGRRSAIRRGSSSGKVGSIERSNR